ncbi:glycosyltransferase family 4 protein, partial [Paraclostridium bifermentans]
YLSLKIKIKPNSIFHSSYYRIANQRNVINIVTVHDFTYEYFISGLAKKIHVLQKKNAIKKSDGIICVSENTKEDLIKFYPYIDENKIKVIYNGVSDDFYNIEDSENKNNNRYSQQKFIMFVGDRSGYKNFDVAIKVVENMENYKLMIIGGKELSQYEIRLLKNSIGDRYEHLKGISNEELNILYNSAFCLLYPSSYEGFGIPVIEAMKSGCPVVAMKCSSIPEVAGNAGVLVENKNYDEFIEAVKKLENQPFRGNIIKAGFKQAQKFSWEKTYKDTVEFYKEIYNYHR